MKDKPKWETAPEWARFLTCDNDGWFWWENEPITEDTFDEDEAEITVFVPDPDLEDEGEWEFCGYYSDNDFYIEKRPARIKTRVI